MKITTRLQNIEIVKDVTQVIFFMKTSGVRLKFFLTSLSLSLGLTLFSLYTVSLLFPLTEGIIKGDFGKVQNLKVVGGIAARYPETFSSSVALFVLLVVWIYATIIVKNALHYGAFLSSQYQAKRATIKLRDMLLEKCLSFGKAFYDKNKIAYVHAVITRSTATIETQFGVFQNLIIQIFLLLMYLFIMIRISWKLTLISVITFPLISLLTRNVIDRIRVALRDAEQASMDLNNKVMNLLYGMPIIKGFAKEQREKELFAKASGEEIEKSFRRQKISNLLSPIEDIGSMTSALLLALGMAVLMHLDSSIDPTAAIVFFYLAQKIIPGLNAINNFKFSILNSSKAVEDINDMLSGNDHLIVASGEKRFDGLRSGIEIRDLSFSYDEEGKKVLENISMHIPKGKMTAIVGPTGSGKSTIANLLLRFYDCPPGSIFIDGTDIREYDTHSLLRRMSFVVQDVILFNTTIGHNLSYGNEEEVGTDELQRIAQKTTVHDFVEKMPEKYETAVSERGSNFSGGEKQRLSITRALMKDFDILILDEATSSLDAATEARVVEAIEELFPEKTIIVISHRLSTIRKADNIVFLKDGKICEQGTLQELLDLGGLFYGHWDAQKLS